MKNLNTTALAYIGDAVYELYIRRHVLDSGRSNVDILHKTAVKYVRAEAQSTALKKIFDELSEEEQILVKRARNRKIVSKPKNADPVTYKYATAFEALVGELFLSGNRERLEEVIGRAIAIIDSEGDQ